METKKHVCRRLAAVVVLAAATTHSEEATMRFVDNGRIRVGVDTAIGGAITHVSDVKRGENLINSHDWGRQIQMSFYSGPQNYQREGKRKKRHWAGFPWNPIQSGDCFGNGSKTLDCRAEGHTLYVKSRPMLWPMDNDPGECVFETWITLEANTFRYRARLTNQRADKTWYGPYPQEAPAVYTNGVWHRLMTYVGDRPYEGESLTEVRKTVKESWPWSKWLATENWSALVDDSGWGIGTWHPGAYEYHGGFAGRRGRGGPKDGPTGYYAPMYSDLLDHNIVFEYECVFIVGSLDEIRRFACAAERRASLPEWAFATSRAHWTLHGARDQGWPIEGSLRVSLNGPRVHLASPLTFWRADQAPTLKIRAACNTASGRMRVRWRPYSPAVHTAASWHKWSRDWWQAERSITVPIQNDKRVREITVPLASAPAYQGALCGLRIDFPEGRKGDTVIIERVALGE